MKDCKTIHPMLALHVDGALPPKDAARVEAHLAQCAEAREELEQHRKLRRTLTSLPDPAIPNDLHAKIMDRLGAKPTVRRPFLLPLPAWGLAAAACLTLFLLHQNPELTRFDEGKFQKSAPPAAPAEEKKAPQPFVAQKKEGEKGAGSSGFSTNGATAAGALDKEKDSSRSTDISRAGDDKQQAADFALPQPAAGEPRAKMARKAKSAERRDEVQGQAMADAAPAAPAGGFGLEAAMAPPAPTPVPTEGMMKTLSLSRQFTASAWSGLNAPATQESAELVTDAAAFTQIWAALRPGQTPPTVDFGTQAVVFLQAGEKPAAGYDIRVSRLEEQEDQLLVHYQVLVLTLNGASAQVLTHPWSLQVIPKPSKPVSFQKD